MARKESLGYLDEFGESSKEGVMKSANDTQEAAPAVPTLQSKVSSAVSHSGNQVPSFCNASQQVGIAFNSTEELDAAIDWLWTDTRLRDLPRVHVGRNTMIIPASAVDLFRDKGIHFAVSEVISAGDLPTDDLNRVRREG